MRHESVTGALRRGMIASGRTFGRSMSMRHRRPYSLILPAPLRLLMRRAADPLRCRAALAQMYDYWEP